MRGNRILKIIEDGIEQNASTLDVLQRRNTAFLLLIYWCIIAVCTED
jgi:hypothetical protein